jgi:diguanylate cyclase (GGDEF)-like protein
VDDPRISSGLAQATSARSGYWQPVRHGERTVGVLATFWPDGVVGVPDRTVSLLGLFAAEAAAAIERADLTSRLRGLSITDDLTRVANRRGFDEALARELARALRTVTPLCVVMLDLDHFKRFNDERGHPAGDAFLRDVAATWRGQLRSTDTLARFGGEEFVAILPDCDTDGALELTRRLLAGMPEGQTASAGIARWNARESADELVARADDALYASKAAGRNRVIAA